MRVPFAILVLFTSLAHAQSLSVSQSGYLLDATDHAVDATVDMRFHLYTSATGGTATWAGPADASPACSVVVRAGYYAVRLGDDCGSGLTTTLLPPDATRWLEVTIGTTTLQPRVALGPAIGAARALTSDDTQALITALAGTGTVNAPTNPVSWTKLKDVPAGLGDGTDDVGVYTAGGGLALTSGQFSVPAGAITPSMLASDATGLARVTGGAASIASGDVVATGSVVAQGVKVGAGGSCSSGSDAGRIRFNSGHFEGCNGTAWVTLEGSTGPALTINNVSPATGLTRGGTTITVTGTGFVAGLTIKVGGVAATNVNVLTVSTATATAPALTTPGVKTVTVETSGGAVASLGGSYTVAGGGESQANATQDCKTLRAADNTLGSAVYWIDPTGGVTTDAFEAYCEMGYGGGWTLISNRRSSSNNTETCGATVGEFFTNGCGTPQNIGYTESYALTASRRLAIGWTEQLLLQFSAPGVADTDDAYVLTFGAPVNLFPNTTTLLHVPALKVCNIDGIACDTADVVWKYIGDYWFHSAQCYSGSSSSTSFSRGNYGLCHDGALDNGNASTYSLSGKYGNRNEYNESKAFGSTGQGSSSYQERIFVR